MSVFSIDKLICFVSISITLLVTISSALFHVQEMEKIKLDTRTDGMKLTEEVNTNRKERKRKINITKDKERRQSRTET